ncbi:TetR/AcrR family transcriptional regulator [Catenulispora sp. NL8]|uniref:TetR/AcrR family transcriptional regulator n=1 Tax=Catenulispora pinistramenti TaxID=2705254 RepID=A0ABS5KRF8_9ACTN|nr:TetR/AcrR family transcriptional regulator [Catenulispora pinistramenti]MBS2548633.1 TetR/AcrR family transcriptional regulator [Catenulispora pinistramenti]
MTATKEAAESSSASSSARPMRADARRNYSKLLAEAAKAFAEFGADASLDEIAKRAGVGNATLYRHFPTREALLEAVYREDISGLCDLAYASAQPADATAEEAVAGLTDWLRAAIERGGAQNGLKSLLAMVLRDEGEALGSWCRESITSAAGFLLTWAQTAGAVRPDLDTLSLLRLVNAISIAAETGGAETAEHLMSLVVDGLRAR